MNKGMPESPEPFFSEREWKALWVLRPGDWRHEWSTEPSSTKVLTTILVVLFGFGVYALLRGSAEVGWTLIGLVAVVPAVVAFGLLARVFVATVRWVFRKAGLLPAWRRSGKSVLSIVFWGGIGVALFIALLPYLSLNPTKSWYALEYEVPVERIEIDKKPHDCEFLTAPIGDKHCHYAAQVAVLGRSDSPDRRTSLLISYEKVED